MEYLIVQSLVISPASSFDMCPFVLYAPIRVKYVLFRNIESPEAPQTQQLCHTSLPLYILFPVSRISTSSAWKTSAHLSSVN